LVIWVFGLVFFYLIWSPRLRNDTSSLCMISSLSHRWWCFIVSSIPLFLSPLFESSRLHFYICSQRKCFGLIFCYREMCEVLMKILPISLLSMLLSCGSTLISRITALWKEHLGDRMTLESTYLLFIFHVYAMLSRLLQNAAGGLSNPPKVVFFLRIRYEYDNNFGEFEQHSLYVQLM